MRVLLVHNQYRSATPSGENRVVDQEGQALARSWARGHAVRTEQRRDRALVKDEKGVVAGEGGLEPRDPPRPQRGAA